MKQIKSHQGFTLIELLVTIMVLVLLTLIVTSAFYRAVENPAAVEEGDQRTITTVTLYGANGENVRQWDDVKRFGINGTKSYIHFMTEDDEKITIKDNVVIQKRTVNTDTTNTY